MQSFWQVKLHDIQLKEDLRWRSDVGERRNGHARFRRPGNPGGEIAAVDPLALRLRLSPGLPLSNDRLDALWKNKRA